MRSCQKWAAIAGAMLVLVLSPRSWADPPSHSVDHHGCPKPSYSPCHYWAPAWYRVGAYLHPPALNLYTSGPPTNAPAPQHVIRFPCPPVSPEELVQTRRIMP